MSMPEHYRTIPILQEGKTYSPQIKEISYTLAMDATTQNIDPARILIVEKAKEKGLSLAHLSKCVGKSHSYFQQFIKRGIPRNLPEDVRELVAEEIGVDEQKLRGPPSARQTARPVAQNARVGGRVSFKATIPAYGQAVGGKDGQFVLNGNKIADVLAPPSLAGVADAYVVYVVGDSMSPRYFAGEACYVNPRLPVRRDNFVVTQIATVEGAVPDAYIKQFISMDERYLRLQQFKPKKTLQFAAKTVVSVHRIIMGGDG